MKRLLNIFGAIVLASPLTMIMTSCHIGDHNNSITVSQLKEEDSIENWNQVFNDDIFYENDAFTMATLKVNADNNIAVNQLFQFNISSDKLLVTDPIVSPTVNMVLIELGAEKQTNKTGDFKIMLYKISPKLNVNGIYDWDYNACQLFYTATIKCHLPIIDFNELKLDDYSEYVKNIDQIKTIDDINPVVLEEIKTKFNQYLQTTIKNNWNNIIYQLNTDYKITFVTLVKNKDSRKYLNVKIEGINSNLKGTKEIKIWLINSKTTYDLKNVALLEYYGFKVNDSTYVTSQEITTIYQKLLAIIKNIIALEWKNSYLQAGIDYAVTIPSLVPGDLTDTFLSVYLKPLTWRTTNSKHFRIVLYGADNSNDATLSGYGDVVSFYGIDKTKPLTTEECQLIYQFLNSIAQSIFISQKVYYAKQGKTNMENDYTIAVNDIEPGHTLPFDQVTIKFSGNKTDQNPKARIKGYCTWQVTFA